MGRPVGPDEIYAQYGYSSCNQINPYGINVLFGTKVPRFKLMEVRQISDPTFDQQLLERIRGLHVLAMENNICFCDKDRDHFDQKAKVIRFTEGQLVLLYKPANLNTAFLEKDETPPCGTL